MLTLQDEEDPEQDDNDETGDLENSLDGDLKRRTHGQQDGESEAVEENPAQFFNEFSSWRTDQQIKQHKQS